MSNPQIHIHLALKPSKQKEILKEQKKRLRLGYPKIGDVITAIKSRKPFLSDFEELGRIEKGKSYVVEDNIDLIFGYYHVRNDNEGVCILLSPKILEEFFGIKLKMNPSVR